MTGGMGRNREAEAGGRAEGLQGRQGGRAARLGGALRGCRWEPVGTASHPVRAAVTEAVAPEEGLSGRLKPKRPTFRWQGALAEDARASPASIKFHVCARPEPGAHGGTGLEVALQSSAAFLSTGIPNPHLLMCLLRSAAERSPAHVASQLSCSREEDGRMNGPHQRGPHWGQ